MKRLSYRFFFLSLLTEYIKNYPKGGKFIMANKRTLKKSIENICANLFVNAVAFSLYGPTPDKDNADSLAFSIVKLQDNFIRRVSHPEPGMTARAYYKNLWEEFSAQVIEIQDQMSL